MATIPSRLAVAVIALVGAMATACAADDSITSPVPAADSPTTSIVPPASTTTVTVPAPTSTSTVETIEDDPVDTSRQEHDSPQPRLVMIEADTGMIQVLDIETGQTVATLESAVDAVSPGEAPSSSEDGRFVFFSHYGQDRITIVDSGTWTEGHGTHGHYYTDEPGWWASWKAPVLPMSSTTTGGSGVLRRGGAGHGAR